MGEVDTQSDEIAPGDVVQLKSFGPPMTVVSVEVGGVNVIWYDQTVGDVKTRLVPAVALEKIDLTVSDEEDDDEGDEDEDEWRGDEKPTRGRGRKKP